MKYISAILEVSVYILHIIKNMFIVQTIVIENLLFCEHEIPYSCFDPTF